MFFSKITDYFLHGAAAIAIILALAMIFFYAPVEKSMGIVQKIFYFHVGSAITMMVFFLICSVSGILYIIKRKDIFDIAGLASAEIGVLFACIVLVTGPLWARKAWGTFWTWEPRLTLTLLIFFIFIAYLSLRKFAGSDRFSATIASGLSVLGIPSVYFIHTAVQRWGGNHPEVVYRGGLLNDEMKLTFYMSISALILLGIVLFQVRYSIEKIQRKIDELYLFSGDIK